MRDYFGSLAARTLQLELAVQPRPRAHFEAMTAAAGGQPTGGPDEKGAVAAPSQPRVEARRPSRSARETDREAEVTPEERLPPRHVHPSKTRPAATGATAGAGKVPAPHSTVRAVEPAADARPEAANPVSRRVPRQSERRGEGHADALTAAAFRSTRFIVAPTGPGARSGQTAASAPSIRIHIGRVDVRAIAAAPQTQTQTAPRKPGGALSTLEEYVRQRDGGRP